MAPSKAILKPFQLLEINIISAQDLEPVSRKMKTYAKAWVHSERKLASCVDTKGHTSPTWNDKFVFRVDEEFLARDTSAVMIEIYTENWLFRDTLVGTVRVLVGNLIPAPARQPRNRQQFGMRFVALQIRRPSGRPQGILNIGVTLLDSSMRSMPLYRQLSASALGFRDLLDDPNFHPKEDDDQASTLKPMLQRSRSERSVFDTYSMANSSLVAIPGNRDNGSCIFGSDLFDPFDGNSKKGKASSVISGGAELREKNKQKRNKGKASSVVSDTVFTRQSSAHAKMLKQELEKKTQKNELVKGFEHKMSDEMPVKDGKKIGGDKPPLPKQSPQLRRPGGYGYTGAKASLPTGKFVPPKANSFLSDSEVGPSPSEVAAAMARERKYPLEDHESSILSGWSLDDSVEGPMSKLERWRKELPPLYDRGGFSTSSFSSFNGQQRTVRRHNDRSGNGLFSCFGVICGYECQCVCGEPPQRKNNQSNRFYSPSPGRSYL